MYYVTWSEGFRPGLLNRPVGSSNADGSYTVKPEVESDEITNVEFGWKTVLLDGQMRFNGSNCRLVSLNGLVNLQYHLMVHLQYHQMDHLPISPDGHLPTSPDGPSCNIT